MDSHIEISIDKQQLKLFDVQRNIIRLYQVSTAAKGACQKNGSEGTPLGKHIIRAKIGAKLPINTVFVARRPTGELYHEKLAKQFPERDWILTRILWLSGCEPGYNRFGNVDTMRRYIYIHGMPDEKTIGIPNSHGCIRMRNHDIIELFNQIELNVAVNITL